MALIKGSKKGQYQCTECGETFGSEAKTHIGSKSCRDNQAFDRIKKTGKVSMPFYIYSHTDEYNKIYERIYGKERPDDIYLSASTPSHASVHAQTGLTYIGKTIYCSQKQADTVNEWLVRKSTGEKVSSLVKYLRDSGVLTVDAGRDGCCVTTCTREPVGSVDSVDGTRRKLCDVHLDTLLVKFDEMLETVG